ncbi:MAG: hypothetical protein IJN40_04000 [Clostridia bacterium]|nr:hypothetical protein [Clostridia bacterium]
MKKLLIIFILLSSLSMAACQSSDVGVIGGADGPTSIIVGKNDGNATKGQFGEQYEKRPVRMINVDGNLYYDTGEASKMVPRCGTLDGSLFLSGKENEIPLKSGGANFEADGYQNAANDTKEINIDGEWIIFKKYDTMDKEIKGLKYCHYIKGRLNNAAKDSELIVLSEKEDVTFSDVYEPLLSSQYPADTHKGQIMHNSIN